MPEKINRWLAALLPPAAIAGLLITSSATAQASTPAVATGHRVQIHEIYYNSPGPDNGSNASLNAEWVQLYNTSSLRIRLTDWTLRDAAGHVFKFATYTLGAHSYVKIHTGHGSRTQTDRYWNQNWYIWNNTGDTAKLEDTHGGTVDSCSYKGTSAGYLYC